MLKVGIVEVGWTVLFQIMNTVILIGLIYGIYYLIFRLPKKMKESKDRLDVIEKTLKEINEKLDNK